MTFRSRLRKAIDAFRASPHRADPKAATQREAPAPDRSFGFNWVNLQPGESGRSIIDRRTSRDRPIQYTIAPLAARQVWELHRAREESRQLSLTSPPVKAFLQWAVDSTLGHEALQLGFTIKPGDRERLREPAEAIRMAWTEWQTKPLGGAGETVVEVCAKALWNRIIDGDCFIVPYMGRRDEWRLRLYEGDVLAEQITQSGQGIERVLGVERNKSGGPIAYYFGITGGSGGVYAYSVPWSPPAEQRMAASRVWHIHDMREGGGRVRGNPWTTEVLSELARLDDFYEAFVRAAIVKASISIALQQNPEMAAQRKPNVRPFGQGADQGAVIAPSTNNESVKRYQTFVDQAGQVLEIDPGYMAQNIATGHPTSQEGQILTSMERRVCAGLGVSPSTLLGDYSGVSFSAGQLLRQQEAATVRHFQAMIRRQILRRMYYHFFTERWSDWLMKFPRLMPDDMMVFADPKHVLPRYQVLDQARTLAPVMNAFRQGLIDLVEARGLIGMATPDVDAFIDEVVAQLKQVREAGPAPAAEGPGDEDDPDSGDGDDEDDPDSEDGDDEDEGKDDEDS